MDAGTLAAYLGRIGAERPVALVPSVIADRLPRAPTDR
jgi:hypothetical protein